MHGARLAFDTAGGVVTSDSGAGVWMDELDAEITPHVLETGAPAVTFVGARCMAMGIPSSGVLERHHILKCLMAR